MNDSLLVVTIIDTLETLVLPVAVYWAGMWIREQEMETTGRRTEARIQEGGVPLRLCRLSQLLL